MKTYNGTCESCGKCSWERTNVYIGHSFVFQCQNCLDKKRIMWKDRIEE